MLPCLVKSRLHSRQGSPRSSCVSPMSTLDSYSGIPIPSGLLTSFSSNIPTCKPPNVLRPISFTSLSLRTLLRTTKSHLLCFQMLPYSLAKTTGGGGTPTLSSRKKMKPKTANPVVPMARCTHHTATGRRCRLSVSDAHSSLCRQHRAEQIQEQAADHHLQLVRNFEGFQTAQGINHSLKHLYELLAQNR